MHSALILRAGQENVTNPSGFIIQRGVNLSHWLSQDFGWTPREIMITENDMKFIASIGYDHVRLPVDEKEMWLEDGTPNESAFALLDAALAWCRKNNLRVIIDLHSVRTHHFNAANEGLENTLFTEPAAQEAFLDLWRYLSSRYHKEPVDQVAYEIMNEPTAGDNEDWNKLVARSVEVIRSMEQDRVIVLGGNMWQLPSQLPFLKIPEGDKNIILSCHSYSPGALTHFKADWTGYNIYEGPAVYPGKTLPANQVAQIEKERPDLDWLVNQLKEDWGPERLQKEFQPAIDQARKLGLQLYCGEFGCLPTVGRKDRLQYYRDFRAVLEKNGIAWANWEYKGDFGIFEWFQEEKSYGAPDLELIQVLTGYGFQPAD